MPSKEICPTIEAGTPQMKRHLDISVRKSDFMELLQVLKKNWQPSNNMATIQAPRTNRLALKEREWECKFCSGVLTEQSICFECKKPVDLVCLFCGKKTMYDMHEFCYCQLELLVPQTGGISSC